MDYLVGSVLNTVPGGANAASLDSFGVLGALFALVLGSATERDEPPPICRCVQQGAPLKAGPPVRLSLPHLRGAQGRAAAGLMPLLPPGTKGQGVGQEMGWGVGTRQRRSALQSTLPNHLTSHFFHLNRNNWCLDGQVARYSCASKHVFGEDRIRQDWIGGPLLLPKCCCRGH